MTDNFLTKLIDGIATKAVLAIFGIIGGIITIYAFIQEDQVDIRYEVIANTNVLDFNADVSKLEVYYDSTNLKQRQENLRIYTIKIINNGKKHLTNDLYDLNEPLGISVSNGVIIEKPAIIEASNEYLRRHISIRTYLHSGVTFSTAILESGEYFIVRLLVLHRRNNLPTIRPIGKIAGQKSIVIVNATEGQQKQSFWKDTFFGSLKTQLTRTVGYALIFIILVALIVVIGGFTSDLVDNLKRKKLVRKFKKTEDYNYTKTDDAIFEQYIKKGSYRYQGRISLISDESKLNDIYKEYKLRGAHKYHKVSNRLMSSSLRQGSLINDMIKDGLLYNDGNKLVFNPSVRDTFVKFYEFLKMQDAIERYDYGSGSIKYTVTTDLDDAEDPDDAEPAE